MLSPDAIQVAVEIQQKSYKLLLWLGEAIDRKLITFSRAHDDGSAADSAYAWITEHYEILPDAARPEKDRLREFSNYFGSYVTTSFDLVEAPGVRGVSQCGCRCPFCTQLVSASHLRAKRPGKRDKMEARSKRISRVSMLADEEGLQMDDESAAAIACSPAFLRCAAYSAYGLSLLERIRGDEGGVYVLALWREIAWKPEGSPIPGFELIPADIVEAERTLIGAIQRGKTN